MNFNYLNGHQMVRWTFILEPQKEKPIRDLENLTTQHIAGQGFPLRDCAGCFLVVLCSDIGRCIHIENLNASNC